jgi:hypothetical protein
VVLPGTYYIVRLIQVLDSQASIQRTVGTEVTATNRLRHAEKRNFRCVCPYLLQVAKLACSAGLLHPDLALPGQMRWGFDSNDDLEICLQGLTGVPWSSRNVGMGDKITQFFERLTKFQQQLLIEDGMGYFYFVLGRFRV